MAQPAVLFPSPPAARAAAPHAGRAAGRGGAGQAWTYFATPRRGPAASAMAASAPRSASRSAAQSRRDGGSNAAAAAASASASARSVPAEMVDLLLRFADDPLNFDPSSSKANSNNGCGTSTTASTSSTSGINDSVYQSYADTPTRRLRQYKAAHAKLMGHLGRMACTILVGAVGGDGGDDVKDVRFVLWVAGLLRDAGQAEVGDSNEAPSRKKVGGCQAVLEGVARAVNDVIRAASASSSSSSSTAEAAVGAVDTIVPDDRGDGGREGEDPKPETAANTMLSFLLPDASNADLGAAAGVAAREGDGSSLLSFPLAALLRAPSLFDALRRPRQGIDLSAGSKRRRLASVAAAAANFGAYVNANDGDDDDGEDDATSAILLGYVLAHYHTVASASSSSSPFSVSPPSSPDDDDDDDDDDDEGGEGSGATVGTMVSSWDVIKSSTLASATSMGGMVHRLSYIRAGLAAYGIDAMQRSSALVEAEAAEAEAQAQAEEAEARDFESSDNAIEAEQQDDVNAADGAGGRKLVATANVGGVNAARRRWACRCEGTGQRRLIIAGLSPRAIVDLLLQDSAVIPALHRISRLPHRRETVARLSSVLLSYNFFHGGPDGGIYGYDHDGEVEVEDGDEDDGSGVRAVLDLLRRGNGESAEAYLRFLEPSRPASAAAADSDDPPGDGRRQIVVGSKRKRGAEEDSSSGSSRRRRSSPPSARPILAEMEAHLARSDVASAARLCQRLERCPGAALDVKRDGWYLVLDYLHQRGMIFDATDDGNCGDGSGGGGNRQFHLLQVGRVGLDSVKDFLRDVVAGAIDDAERAGRDASSLATLSSSRDEAEAAAAYAREAEDWARYTQLQVRRTMLKFLLCRRNGPTVALAVADEVSLLGDGGGGGSAPRSYLGAFAAAGGGGDAQVLRRIEGILSASPDLRSLPPMPDLASYPPRRGRVAAAEEAPLALEDGGRDEGRDEAADLSAAAAEADDVATEEVAAVHGEENVGEEEQPIPEGAGEASHEASAVVLLDDDDDEEEYVQEEEAEEEEDLGVYEGDEVHEAEEEEEGDIVADGEGEAEEVAVEPRGDAAGSDATADKDDIVEILESSTSEDEVAEEASVDHDVEEEGVEVEDIAAGQDEGGDDQHGKVDEASYGGESVEDDQRVVADQVNEDVVMSDDMDEADEATAEYDEEEERSAREALHDSDSDVEGQEEVAVEAETRQPENASASAAPSVRIVDAEPESVLVQAAMSSQRQHAAGQHAPVRRSSDFSSGAERRGDEDYDDTTCAVAGTDADLSEYYTETSQGTHDSGAEFETEPRVEQPPPSNQAEEAQPGSLLIAAAMSSQRGGNDSSSGGSSGDESGRTGEDYYDDTTAAVVGTSEYLDECFTDVGSQASQTSQRGSDSVVDDAAASEGMGGASQEGCTSAEVSLLEGYEEADQGAGEETAPQGEAVPPMPQGPAPAAGSHGHEQEEEKSEPMAIASHEEEKSEASIADDNVSMTNTSMIVQPSDSPKSSIILEASEAEAEGDEAQNIESELQVPVPEQSVRTSTEAQKESEDLEEGTTGENEGNVAEDSRAGALESGAEVQEDDGADYEVMLSPEQSRVAESMADSVRDHVLSELQKSEEKERQKKAEVEQLQGSEPAEEEEKESLTSQSVEELSYRELQHACKVRGLHATGKTEDLKERLREFLQGEKAGGDISTAQPESAEKDYEGPTDAAEEKTSPPDDAVSGEPFPATSTTASAVLNAPLAFAKAVVGFISPKPSRKEDQGAVGAGETKEGANEIELGSKEEGDGDEEGESKSDAIDGLDELSFHELQHECKIRGLRATGKTQELKERLLEYEARDESGEDAETEEKDVDAPTDTEEMQLEAAKDVEKENDREEQAGGEKILESAKAINESSVQDKDDAATGFGEAATAQASTAATDTGLMSPLGLIKAAKAYLTPKKKDPEIIEIEDSDEERGTAEDVKREDIKEEEVSAEKEEEEEVDEEEGEEGGAAEEEEEKEEAEETVGNGDILTAQKIEELSYRELQTQCVIRFLPATGKKQDLKKRLLDFVKEEEPKRDNEALADSTGIDTQQEETNAVENKDDSNQEDLDNAVPMASDSVQGEEKPEGGETKDSSGVEVVAATAVEQEAAAGTSAAATSSGFLSGIAKVAKAAKDFVSPKTAKKKDPEVIEIDDSDEESVEIDAKPEGGVGTSGGESPLKEEGPQEVGGDAFDGLSAHDIDGLSYHELQHELKARKLKATGKKDDLKKRLLESIQERNTDIPTSVLKEAQSPMSSIASTPDYSVGSRTSRGRARSSPVPAAVGGQKELLPVKEEAEDDDASGAGEELDEVGELPNAPETKPPKAKSGQSSSVTSSRKSSRARKANKKYADSEDDDESVVDGGGASHSSSVTARRRGRKATNQESSNASNPSRRGVRRKKGDEEETDAEEGTQPSPPKRRKRKPASSMTSTRSTRSRATRTSAASGRSTRASRGARTSTARMVKRLQD